MRGRRWAPFFLTQRLKGSWACPKGHPKAPSARREAQPQLGLRRAFATQQAVVWGGKAGMTGFLSAFHSSYCLALRLSRTTVFKIPQSVLVVIHTPALEVLLIERADAPGFWQSVTGSKDHPDDSFFDTAVREVLEETGLDARAPGCCLSDWMLENVYEIYPQWLHRYAPGVTHNTEHLFGLCIPECVSVVLDPREHKAQVWLPWQVAADRCFSPSNAEAIGWLPRLGGRSPELPREP